MAGVSIKNIRVLSWGRAQFLFSKYATFVFILLLQMCPAFIACEHLETGTGAEPGSAPGTDTEENAAEAGTDGTRSMELILTEDVSSLDIFIFNNDRFARLDSYLRTGPPQRNTVTASARSGRKRVVVLANAGTDKYSWSAVNSYSSLKRFLFKLTEEDPQRPVMVGEDSTENYGIGRLFMRLRPLMSMITLSSIRCDFSGKPYAGRRLENVKVYLTNVCSLYPAIAPKDYRTTSFLNQGRLRENDMESIRVKSMLFQEIPEAVGAEGLHPELRLYCYPNLIGAETAGAIYTRIVVEGKIEGRTYYYPIDLDRGLLTPYGYPRGVAAGMEYRIDLGLTRLGSIDPDIPVSRESTVIRCETVGWKEKENEIIDY